MEPAPLPARLLIWMTMPWPAELPRRSTRHLRALVSCEAVSAELPLVVDGSRRPSQAMADHLEACLTCQSELAGYRRLLRALRSLRDEPVLFPSPELIGETLTALSERLVDRSQRLPDRDQRDRWLVAGALVIMGVAVVGAGALLARSGLAGSALARSALARSALARPGRLRSGPGAPGGRLAGVLGAL